MTLGEAIKCRSTASCESATMSTEDEIYCEGVASCSNAQISAATKVYLYGHYAAVNSVITTTSTIRAYGYYALLFATIDSVGQSTLTLKVYGADSGYGANYICRSGSSCSLNCKGGACYALDFLCMSGSTCSLPTGCSDDNSVVTTTDGITCPNVIISDSAANDEEIEQFVVDKENAKTSDKKWALYEDYIADDLSLWEMRDLAVSNEDNKVLVTDGVGDFGYLDANLHSIVGVAVMSFIVAAVCWFYIRAARESYQKL